jgi:hypothetical protein
MKQGASSYNAPQMKKEPVAKAKDVAAVSAIGQSVQYVKPDLNAGRGYMAPKNANETTHKGGSQGRR